MCEGFVYSETATPNLFIVHGVGSSNSFCATATNHISSIFDDDPTAVLGEKDDDDDDDVDDWAISWKSESD